MIKKSYNTNKIKSHVSFLQLTLLFGYLSLNIKNVGEMGVALSLLAGFYTIAGLLIFHQLIRFTLAVRLHLFVFLLLVNWIALRVVVDLGDMEYLKQLTVATTGGLVLFYLLGNFARLALDNLNQVNLSRFYPRLLLLLFVFISLTILISFKARLVRTDIFYIEGVQGGYQRPGNFLIILFIMASFVYLVLAAHPLTKGLIRFAAWLGVYTFGLVLALISSQMIGSNAATANLLAIYMITSVISLVALSKDIRSRFNQGRLSLPLSKTLVKKLLNYSGITLFFTLFFAVIAIQITGFDVNKTRAFGFGIGSNNSVTSRFDILLETGVAQMGYAPLLGNMNVAVLTGSEVGEYLHSFIPNILAELGLPGLFLTLLLFYFIIKSLFKIITNSMINPSGFKEVIFSFWLFFTLVWLFLYANIAVDKSWSVMWFFIGFSANVFVFKKRKEQSEQPPHLPNRVQK